MIIEYTSSQFVLIISILIWLIFAYFAEWKKDFVYCLISTLLSIELATLFISINIYYTVVYIIASGYFGFLVIAYVPFIKKYTNILMENFGLD